MGPDPHFEVFDEEAERVLHEIGHLMKNAMPPGYGFVFLMANYGKKGNTFYTSSVQRQDAVNLMKELIEKIEGHKEVKGSAD